MKRNQKAAYLLLALVTLAPLLNGCRISPAQAAARGARDAEDERILRTGAEQTDAARKQFLDYRARAEQGDAAAQYNIGVCYKRGLGVAADQDKVLAGLLRGTVPEKEASATRGTSSISRSRSGGS